MDAAEIHGVTVAYRLHRIRSFKEALIRNRARAEERYVYGLRDVTLNIRAGESLGILGANGAGKSTLLRVIAGIVTPTEGYAITRGRIAPLLELGAGFEAELSGRENILFNGALLGRSRQEMKRLMGEIVAFSELEPFIDTPLRTYSTGMAARLAVSIALSLDAEVVLMDEILSVGDAAFRERCQRRIDVLIERGATIVVVSHEPAAIANLCRRAVWLSHGSVVADGASSAISEQYQNASHER